MMSGPAAGQALRWDAVHRVARPGTPDVPPWRRARFDSAEAEYLEDVGRPGEDPPSGGASVHSAPPVHRAA
jgi:hypothetical protein